MKTINDARVEALEKVTGRAKYAAEYNVPNVAHAVYVVSDITAGQIVSIDTTEAKQAEGVIEIITHENKPYVPGFSSEEKIKASRLGFAVFHTNKIHYKGQPVAMVIAESLEEAQFAASLVKVQYRKESYQIDFNAARKTAQLDSAGKERGNLEAWEKNSKIVDKEYYIEAQVHHPMEMHATIAHFTLDNTLKLYDKNQGVVGVQRTIGTLFDIPIQNIEVISEFVGGGFGSGLRVWSNCIATVMAAKMVKRPVKFVLTRPQMFTQVGYRPAAWQRVKMGASAEGKLTGIWHQALNGSSTYENFNDGITRVTRLIYEVPNLKTEAGIVPLNLSTPTWMRGPGDCTGDFAIESAIDELCANNGWDPYDFRMENISSEKHPDNGMPWSTHYLKECMEIGAKKIGWQERKSKPQTDGLWKIGYGMAVGAWNAGRGQASAAAILKPSGEVLIQTAMTDIGTGTGTGIVNMFHQATGIAKDKISVELGNSNFPPTGSQGGSTGLSSMSGAIDAVAKQLKEALLNEYKKKNNTNASDLNFKDNTIQLADGKAIVLSELIQSDIRVEATSGPGQERQKYAFLSAAAHFVQVRVHTLTGKVKVDRYIVVADGGKIINPLAAANQMSGAAFGGIGMTLMEETSYDMGRGSLVGDDFAGYHFAVNADGPLIEVEFVNKPDLNINPSGVKGLGEVGIIGTAAAIANAIFDATGKRITHLPITPDKVLKA